MEDIPEANDVPVRLAPGFTSVERLQAARRIAYKEGHRVFVATPSMSDARLLFDEQGPSLNCPLAWSVDGTTVYLSHEQIYAVDTDTAAVRAVTDFRDKDRFGANWLLQPTPDGSSLVFLNMPHPELSNTSGRVPAFIPTPRQAPPT